jgi:hypothetical protein
VTEITSFSLFFHYAEQRGWCTRGLAAGIMAPRVYADEVGSKAIFESAPNVAEHPIRSNVLAYCTNAPACESYLPGHTRRIVGHGKVLTDRAPFIPAAAKDNATEADEPVRRQVNARPEVIQRQSQQEVSRQDTRWHTAPAACYGYRCGKPVNKGDCS